MSKVFEKGLTILMGNMFDMWKKNYTAVVDIPTISLNSLSAKNYFDKGVLELGYVTDPFAFVALKSYQTTSSTWPTALVSERNTEKNDPSSVTKA